MLGSRPFAALSLAVCLAAPVAADLTWGVLTHDGAGRAVAPYLSSLAGGERGTGAMHSEAFVLDADTITFTICGADGWPGQRRFRNWFALCDADTGRALRRVPPPGVDPMTPVRWDVVELIGRRVYFRAVDGRAAPDEAPRARHDGGPGTSPQPAAGLRAVGSRV